LLDSLLQENAVIIGKSKKIIVVFKRNVEIS